MHGYRKYLILTASLFLFTAADYPVRRVCENADGTLSVASYVEENKLNESDKEFLDRMDLLTHLNSAEGKVCFDVHRDDIPYNKLDDSEKWRVKEQGGKKIVFVDNSAPSPEKDKREKKKQGKTKAKNELKQLGLSDDAISALGL